MSDLGDRLHSVAVRLLRRVREADHADGVGPARLSALSVLVFGGPHTVSELARTEQVAVPTMTRIVQGLVETGLATTERHPDDARKLLVAPTDEGRRLLEAARMRRVERMRGLLQGLTTDEREQVQSAIDLLERSLGGQR